MWLLATINRSPESDPLPFDMFNPYAVHTTQTAPVLSKEEFRRAARREARLARLGRQ